MDIIDKMLSAIILTKNEENTIIDCLESISFVDEIIIIDDYSDDRTEDVVKSFRHPQLTVYKRRLNNDFSSQRNFGLSKAKGEWVLFLDADERISKDLAEEIRESIFANTADAYYMKRLDNLWGKVLIHGETGNIYLIRLAKVNSGSWKGKVHEEWEVKGRTSTLINSLYHFPHQTIREFISEVDTYSTFRAQELYDKKVHTSWISIIAYPKAKFIYNYLLRGGFLDGVEGLVVALMMSFHSFLVRGKLYLLWKEKKRS